MTKEQRKGGNARAWLCAIQSELADCEAYMLHDSIQGCSSTASSAGELHGDNAEQPDLQAAAASTATLQYPYHEDGPLRKVHPYK